MANNGFITDLQKTVGDLEDLEEELKSTVSAQKSDLLMLQRAYDDKNAELEDLLETHAEAVLRIDQLENGVKSLRAGRHESDSALLDGFPPPGSLPKQPHHETHAEAVSRIDQLENGVKSLREGRHESDSALLEVENRASLWEKLNHEQASTSELAKQALAEKVSAIDLLRETVEDLQGRLDRSESALKQKDAALNRQLEKASDLSRRFDTLESDHRRREDLVRQTADRLAAAEDTIQRLDAQRVDAETDLAKKVQSVRSLEQAVEQLRVRNRTLTDERVSLLASIGEKDTEPGPPGTAARLDRELSHARDLASLAESVTGSAAALEKDGIANTPGALRPSALAAKLSQSLLHEQRAADSLREERDQLLGEITGLKGTAARLDRELSHARDLASLAESATGRAAAVEKDGSRRFEVCQARAAELEAAKDEILADRDAVAADLFRAEAAVKKLNGERAEVATLLQKAVAKHHAHVTPPPPREGAGGPSLADMARALVQAAAADNRVAGVAEPLQRLCAVLGVGQEQGRSDDGALENVWSLCGDSDAVGEAVKALGAVTTVKRLRHAGSYYKGNTVKLLELAEDTDGKVAAWCAAEKGFSIHPAVWVVKPPGGIELEVFLRKAARGDKTMRPPLDILEAADRLTMNIKVMRASASGYRVFVDPKNEGEIERLAAYLDAAGIAVKRDGVFVKTKEQAMRDKERYWEMVREGFGVTGLDRMLGEYEMGMILKQVGIERDYVLRPVYGLGKGTTAHSLEGLDEDEQADLQRYECKLLNRRIRFGKLRDIIGDGDGMKPTYASVATREDVGTATSGTGMSRPLEQEMEEDGDAEVQKQEEGEKEKAAPARVVERKAGSGGKGHGGKGNGAGEGRGCVGAKPTSDVEMRTESTPMKRPRELATGATPPPKAQAGEGSY
ncbi:hypothetical protein DIPPA_11676 [Diplonema papillatum]|nr:hypothetical protein DIPPA_11676 [Diplonema papillatum]